MSRYRVPIIRVPETQPPPHKYTCSLSDLKSYVGKIKRPLALDLFCGAGGLSLGLQEAGFDVILGVDCYVHGIATHRAHFGGVSLIGNLSTRNTLREIENALKGVPVALIAGGPPCQPFSRAGKNKIRSLKREANSDSRQELWRNFVYLVKRIKPQAVLIENVPDLGFGENSIVFRKIVSSLEASGYGVESRILSTWHFGVPQHRQRLIIVGMRNGLSFRWPRLRVNKKVTVRDAIADLPGVSGGARQVELPYGAPMTSFQRWARRGLRRRDKYKIFDHLTRPVRDDDLEAFRLMKQETLYSQLPSRLRRYRSDIFDDKYKRLPWDGLSRSITAHIGRDGYWYIHPRQHRTLTVREAARIQTFPDRFRFAGTPSHAFRQIGEAVPPLFAKALAKAILFSIKAGKTHQLRPSTTKISLRLSNWIKKRPRRDLVAPWRHTRRLWPVLLGTLLFARAAPAHAARSWPMCANRWLTPKDFLKDEKRATTLRLIGFDTKMALLNKIARKLSNSRENVDELNSVKAVGGLNGNLDLALALTGRSHRRPVTVPVIRLAGRFFGEVVNGSKMAAEHLLGRLVGVDKNARAYAAVLEIAEGFCRPGNPDCRACPLTKFCDFRNASRKSTTAK